MAQNSTIALGVAGGLGVAIAAALLNPVIHVILLITGFTAVATVLLFFLIGSRR